MSISLIPTALLWPQSFPLEDLLRYLGGGKSRKIVWLIRIKWESEYHIFNQQTLKFYWTFFHSWDNLLAQYADAHMNALVVPKWSVINPPSKCARRTFIFILLNYLVGTSYYFCLRIFWPWFDPTYWFILYFYLLLKFISISLRYWWKHFESDYADIKNLVQIMWLVLMLIFLICGFSSVFY